MAASAQQIPVTPEIINEGRTLALRRGDGAARHIPALWLRDNDPRDRDPDNGQKLTNITDLAEDARITAIEEPKDGGLQLTFSPDGRRIEVDAATLIEGETRPLRTVSTWAGTDFSDGPPSWHWKAVREDPASLRDWLRAIRAQGFAILSEVPNEAGMVTRVAERFGHVRETNYGRLFDVRAEPDPINLAFTGLALSVHTDNPYRDPVPGIQLLHCLESDAEGGDTVLVDGFNAAERLRAEAPEAFRVLSTTWVTFRYAAGGADLSARVPMIAVDDRDTVVGIRFNNRSLAPLDLPADAMPAFYRAYRRFAEILFDPASALTFKLSPGELFAVDNRRVLHGRTAFSAAGRRHLQGCYADMDGLLSTLSVLEREGATV